MFIPKVPGVVKLKHLRSVSFFVPLLFMLYRWATSNVKRRTLQSKNKIAIKNLQGMYKLQLRVKKLKTQGQ